MPKSQKKSEKRSIEVVSGPVEKMNILDVAYRVLCESGTPMKTKEIVETSVEKGYWATSGNPHLPTKRGGRDGRG